MSPLSPAPVRKKRSDELADAMRLHIIRNKLRSGDRLPKEKELIEQLGASRATVREALKSLEVQGLIYNMTGPDGGARVADASVDHAINLLRNFFYFNPISASQLYQVRLIVEPELASSVAGHLSAEQLAALDANVTLQENTPITVGTWKLHRETEVVFHDILAAACPNPLLALVARFINQVIRTNIATAEAIGAFETFEAFTHDNMACHRQVLEALRKGHASKVRRLMLEHIAEAGCHVSTLEASHALLTGQARPALDKPSLKTGLGASGRKTQRPSPMPVAKARRPRS